MFLALKRGKFMNNEIKTQIGDIKLYRNISGFLGLASTIVTGINCATTIINFDNTNLGLAIGGAIISGSLIVNTALAHQKVKVLENPKVIDLNSYRK